MKPAPAHLEPAVVDPKKLRRTAWILVGIMILGGALVLKAYSSFAKKQDADGSPAKIHRIQKERSLRMLRQDGTTDDLFTLRGKTVVLNLISLAEPELTTLPETVMKELAETYRGNSDVRFVTLVIDPPGAENLAATLTEASRSRGIAMPQWWLGTNERKTLHKFIRNELKPSVPPEIVGGKWRFDTSLVLIDRDGHLRRPIIQQKRGGPPFIATFDFNQAAGWDSRGVKTGTNLSNAAELRKLLETTIGKILRDPTQS